MDYLAHMLLYIDPGSGSILFQLLVAGVLGFLFYLKKLRRAFYRLLGKKTEEKNEDK